MAVVASLFSSQAEASQAIDALAGTPFEDVEVNVYEEGISDDMSDVVVPFGTPGDGTALSGTGPPLIFHQWLTEVGDEALSRFFLDAVENGQGVLLVADVNDERAEELRAFFKQAGGRVAVDD